ncbi:MAG: hypothetical protein KKB37_15485, partial [Alphaproteobacteria bacterium]|nr:hypothetical protein [Alphaproteobacteria bacterium]
IQATARAQHALKLPQLDQLYAQLAEIARFPLPHIDSDMMHRIRKATEGIKAAGGTKALQEALKTTSALRNAIAHAASLTPTSAPRPAYRLGDDTDG